ncbi:substrate-binding domain-containing protein [Actinocorallia sp. A-T 12471]|uniref:substrate-binding domain-containing protein n=1 Tax=Actinocorallia sp. A-T 12471 TaxID=3089813 RepID=UPI0029CC57C8|nr:substrate-binding domain-containing protein [Actinocorallia sp. A-T 12471]MDX6739111.1 substrate-binding domain-containing protein [Actinocorallia sp. A-T 12471]
MLKKMVLSVAAAMLAVSVVQAPASADPGFTPSKTDLVGVGSDTTQDVVNALAAAYNKKKPAARLASFNATGSATFTPKAGLPKRARVVGSSNGIKALQADTEGAYDFARSSRAKKTDGTEATLAFYAFAQDGVTWAVNYNSFAPKNLKKSQLANIYKCSASARYWDQVGGKKNGKKRVVIKPWLPQAGSGTRSFFLGAIGLTDAQVGSCVNQKATNIENDGKKVGAGRAVIAPFSIGQWIAQAINGKNDRHGKLVLGKIGGVSPTTGKITITKKGGVKGKNIRLNASDFPRQHLRLVYNVVRAAEAAKFEPIFGQTGFLCDQTKTIRAYGFEPIGGGCGAVS